MHDLQPIMEEQYVEADVMTTQGNPDSLWQALLCNPVARRWALWGFGLGLFLFMISSSGTVNEVFVSKRDRLDPNFSLFGTSNQATIVCLLMNDGKWRFSRGENWPIGGGLRYQLSNEVLLADCKEVHLCSIEGPGILDSIFGSGENRYPTIDRAYVRDRIVEGEKYSFELIGSNAFLHSMSVMLIATSGLYLSLALIWWIRIQAI